MEHSEGRDERTMTGWHVIAFLGEVVLWVLAAFSGYALVGGGPLGWMVAILSGGAIVAIWAVWAAPRSPRRLPLGPRLALIGVLGVTVAASLLPAGAWAFALIALLATAAVVVAQWFDARSG